jgi:RNA polymerase sigma factor (sigma-70 family)
MYKSVFIKKITELEPALYAFAIQLTKDRYLAKDLVQDTYINALLYQHSYRPNKLLKTWLFSILYHRFVGDYDNANKIRETFDATKDVYKLEIQSDDLSPELMININDLHLLINSISNTSFKVTFNLYLEGYKYDEIAIKLNIPVNTVRTKIWNARQELIKKIKHG